IVIKKKSNSDTVAGFYGNNSDSITITSANETKNKNRGIYLKGVYFVNNGISDHTLYSNGKYTTSKVYYAAASNGSVTVTPNQNFIKTLRDKGVISDVHSDATIKVYPVFAQEEVIVCFENTDRDDSKSATRGKFDSNNKASYIVNILEANKNGKVGKYQTGGWLDYYYIYVPKYSVIRVQTQPISTRVAAGVSYWYWGSNEQRTYYRSGDTKFSGTTPSGEKITQTDYTKADIVASNDVSMRPATGEQTFDIRYFPKANIPDEYTGANGLTNAVLLSDVDSNQVIGADKSGKYTFRNPFVGMSWSLTAVAPDGYYTQWVNMTGDTNGDGYISDSEGKAIKNKSATFPDEVYGNKISGQLDQDNFKLYYYFLPKTGGNGANKTGVVTRAPENFYQLANRIKSSSKATPVVGAYVDVGGFIGMTDGKGEYSIECKDLPIAGNVSTTINADGSTTYHTISKLQRHTPIELPALSKFNAVSISASYDKDGKINSDWITVKDDKLTISATVSSESAITPKKARFFIYDDSDNEIKTLDGADGYTVSTKTSGNNFTASLTFNPTKDMKWGYKIYAQFADQNDEWTNVIDLGYYFSSQLNLAEFVFPLIGSSSLEDTIRTGFVADIIGDPLGDTSIGSINKFETKDYKYTPAQIDEQYKQDYTWQRTDYSFGWSDTFYRKETTTSKESDEKKLLAYLKSIYDGKSGGKAPPTPSKFSTKSKFRWEITPSVGFNLTLSSRKDKYVYFEDLVFYVKADFNVMANQAIQLPIGISVLVQGELKGNIAGIYHMYVDYKDKYETEDAVRYTSENFGIFKKFNNSVRREGYIFLDPTVAVKLGIGVGIVFVTGNANFIFDMDFRFTEGGTDTYGDITIDLGWGIQLVGFEVYAKSLYDVTYKLFNSSGQNGHINFDYAAANNLALMSAAEYFETDGDEKLTLDKPVSRDYLNNRSRWLGEDDEMILAAYDVSEGTIENTLRNGTTESPYVRMMELDNGEILMVFIDDDESRSNVNKRALYYSVYNGSGWSQPVLADNDGTPDDYPTLCDLGDGRIFVAWSSAERILPDNATVEDVLKAMNIKASFFDKQTKQMGEVMQITKTTDKDYTADVMPGAAYDSTTDRLILYYTKTEYDGLEKLTDISDAYSVNAYMFYENGKWSDADDYEADELDGVENPEEYKKNWYGQRFLDLRINTDSDNMPRVADTASISCNGLGLFAWTVDWDTNLETNNDRDVFMQIYNFDENSFTHIIRVTPETSVYTTPKFERSDNGTYLFYGASTADESEGSVHSEIKYLNISDLIKNDRFTKISEAGNNEYYIFRYTREAYTTEDPDGNVVENPAEDIIVTADTAVVCNNAVDYDVKVSKDGQMFLFWTDTVNEARQIMVSAYNGADADDDDEENDQNKENADSSESFWSEPVVLTDAEADEYYSGLGAAVVDGTLIAASAKGNYNDTSTSSLVWQKHTPFSKVRTTGIRFDSEYPYPLASTDLIATVKNEGLAPRYVSDEPVTVTFTINGKIAGTADVISTIPGGKSVDVICSVELPEDISNLEIGAYIEESDSVSAKLETNSDIELENNTIELYKDNDGCRVAYSATMRNNGNAAIDNTVFTAMTGETEIGNLTIELLEANDEQNIDITLDIPDSAYTINNDGVGYAEISINAVSGDKTVAYYNGRAEKVFSAEAIALLDSVTEIVFKNDGTYKMKSGDKEDIQPEFGGIDPGDLIVQWIDSSDSNAAYIDYDNMIIAQNKGTTTITGIVVPNEERIEFDVNGNAQKVDWETLIPKDKMVKVTAVINVSETKRSGSKGGSGGTVSANLTETPAPTTDPKATSEPEITTDPKATSEPEITTDPKATSEPQPAPTSSTSNLQFDDTADHWAKDYIERLSANGMVNGMADRIFEPNGSVTRAQFAQILMKTGIVSAGNITVPSFTDVDPDAWYYEAVTWAVSCGIANGMSDEIFEPESNITREQMAAMINRFIKLAGIEAETVKEIAFIDADSISDWARADIEALATMGIVSGRDTGEFAPHANMTRAESAVVICNILDVKGV
ncbi:MAG: S-layer homology domain-containing protein, partial [Oscillospiraceae bacterium]|nr:S-layer homology domain-containing protein [Oscillospiraceae bacterium]